MNHTTKTNQSTFTRIGRFPLRAILGLEPIWLVLPVGVATLYLIFKATTMGLGKFAGMNPVPSYVLPVAYFALTIFVLAQVWFFISLWNSAGRLSVGFGKIIVRLLVLVAAVYLGLGDISALQVLENTFSPSQMNAFQ